jgi:hypothetical protein
MSELELELRLQVAASVAALGDRALALEKELTAFWVRVARRLRLGSGPEARQ